MILRRLLTALLATVVGTLAASNDSRKTLVDVGDHKLAVSESGQGKPTVILEAGGGGEIRSWDAILPKISEFTSVIAYARAGQGDSEPAKTPRRLSAVVEELRALLQRSNHKPPYVLVGRSLGGIYVRAFAMTYPGEVVGLVLVDGSHERQGIEYARATGITIDDYIKMVRSSVPPGAMRREMEGLEPIMTAGDLGVAGKLPDIPLVVITNIRTEGPIAATKAWRNLQNSVFESTTQGMHIVTNRSGHDIASKEPDLVIDAVCWVVDRARQDRAEKRLSMDGASCPGEAPSRTTLAHPEHSAKPIPCPPSKPTGSCCERSNPPSESCDRSLRVYRCWSLELPDLSREVRFDRPAQIFLVPLCTFHLPWIFRDYAKHTRLSTRATSMLRSPRCRRT